MRARSVLARLLLCVVLSACGGMDGTTPSAPGGAASPTPALPTPSPSPVATRAGYLHVLQRPWVMTYEIDPSGRLKAPVTQHVSNDLLLLAGEPQGRFIYAAHGGWSVYGSGMVNGSDGTIVTYAPDPRDGTLAEVSETNVARRPAGTCGTCGDIGGWKWLKGGTNRIHGLWDYHWGTVGRHTTHSYVSIPVASDGQHGPVSRRSFIPDADPGQMLVDVRADVLYKAGTQPVAPGTESARGGLEAHLVEADGTITRMGWSNLCFARPMSEYALPIPLVTARGFVFASLITGESASAYHPTLCAYQGLRLKPIDALDFTASPAEAFVPSSETEPALLAMNVTFGRTPDEYRFELQVFAMDADGDLTQLYTEEFPSRIHWLLFHPSRRFLYLADAISQLRTYAVDASGHVELLMTIDGAGGSMAISL